MPGRQIKYTASWRRVATASPAGRPRWLRFAGGAPDAPRARGQAASACACVKGQGGERLRIRCRGSGASASLASRARGRGPRVSPLAPRGRLAHASVCVPASALSTQQAVCITHRPHTGHARAQHALVSQTQCGTFRRSMARCHIQPRPCPGPSRAVVSAPKPAPGPCAARSALLRVQPAPPRLRRSASETDTAPSCSYNG